MRILLNGLTLTGKKTGVGHYVCELIRCLREEPAAPAIDVYQPTWVQRARAWLPLQRQVSVSAPPSNGSPSSWRSTLVNWAYAAGEMLHHWEFRSMARRGAYDLYHEPNFLPIDCDLPAIVTVHDLSVLLHPQWHPADRVTRHLRQFHRGVQRCRHVITGSDHVRQEVIQTLGLPPEKVTRVYYGIRPGLAPLTPEETQARRRELGLPEQYLLYLGTIEPRKNVLTLLKAYCALPLPVRLRYPLLLVGSWGWNSGDIHQYLHDEARHRGVQYLGYLPEEALPVLYNAARALVFPSHYEGFGLPPAEMLACGGAVLASTAGSIVEAVGGKACLIEPDDLAGWRDAMQRVCTDDGWWQELRQGGPEAVKRFTWEACAAGTLAVYEATAGKKRRTTPAQAA